MMTNYKNKCNTIYFNGMKRSRWLDRKLKGQDVETTWFDVDCKKRESVICMKKATRQIINEAKEKPKQSTSVGKWFLESFFL